ncbi:hypothetical protein D0B54_02310 [Solimonas sp. K1W22B-7]|uniref:OmpA family protein n=1 Tax=Solimonas sp. K1W22B-7 TaxID=2303331 RepID=UPI000E332050|nr:OmpA family protein [Solimonas sp. K1W22B-7]AXQ27579.1 hypothetical protein D0B54_02310 [Solimonas sp. K1W22B-7]
MKLRLIPWLAAALFCGATQAQADDDYDDRYYLLPMGSYVLADDARNTDDGYGATLAIGKRITPMFELELRGNYLTYDANKPDRGVIGGVLCGLLPCPEPEDVEISAIGAGANFFLGRNFYLHGDVMGGDSTLMNAGVGLHFGGSDGGWGLRVEALYHDDEGDYEETQFNVGLHIPIGSRAAPKEVVEPAQVVPVIEPAPAAPVAPPCELPAAGQPMTLEGCKAGDVIVLRGVNFEFDKSKLTVNAKTLLDMVADALLRRTDIKVEIDGHTDAKGSDAYNQKLSERRAASVKDYLAGRGVDPVRMGTVGFGESKPMTTNETDEGREINRRVELKVVEIGGAAVVTYAPTPEGGTAVEITEPAPAAAPVAAPVTETLVEPEPEASPPLPAPAAAAGGNSQVTIGMMVFEPATITVPAGATVTWTNEDGSNHNVSFSDQQSGRMKKGASWSRSFTAPGEYPYQCSIHGAAMSGKVIVK